MSVYCRVCGRKLKNKKTLEIGVGPVCAKKEQTSIIDNDQKLLEEWDL